MVILLDPREIRSNRGLISGFNPSLEVSLLLQLAACGQASPEELSGQLWPGLAKRWRSARIGELRQDLRVRVGHKALLVEGGMWRIHPDWTVAKKAPRWELRDGILKRPGTSVAVPDSSLDLVEALLGGPVSTRHLALQGGVSESAIRKQVHTFRRATSRSLVLGGGGGYQLSLLAELR